MHSLKVLGWAPRAIAACIAASKLARCSGGNFAICSSVIGRLPLTWGWVATSHSPSLTLSCGVSAACANTMAPPPAPSAHRIAHLLLDMAVLRYCALIDAGRRPRHLTRSGVNRNNSPIAGTMAICRPHEEALYAQTAFTVRRTAARNILLGDAAERLQRHRASPGWPVA